MSWTDKSSVNTIKQLRDYFNVKEFVETGTFKGVNAEVQANNFASVLTVESNQLYMNEIRQRLSKYPNVKTYLGDSKQFLEDYVDDYYYPFMSLNSREDIPIFYLDAHFYNPKGPRWIVQKELEALKGFNNCILIIHDFDNGLGHIVYDKEPLGMNVVGDLLKKVNPDFHYYTNISEGCDIMRPEETDDPVIKDNLIYAWSKPDKGKRGILYCLPRDIELDKFELVKWRINEIYNV